MTGKPLNDQEREARLEELFDKAISDHGVSAQQVLGKAEKEDPSLRTELEALLRAHRTKHPLLDNPILSNLFQGETTPEEMLDHTMDGYRITRHIATGGMGWVFHANHIETDTEVAIKVMPPDTVSPSAIRQFMKEAEILAKLQHPGIASIYSVGLLRKSTSKTPYFAMEYLHEGLSITAYAAKYALSQDNRLQLIVQLCNAVQFGHDHGIVHCDLKPDNILVILSADADCKPQVKIIDFGVAQLHECDDELSILHTRARHVSGTLQYMSPEQLDLTTRTLDPLSDVYSIGAVLFELLYGHPPPIQRVTAQHASRHERAEIEALQNALHHPHLDKKLVTIIQHCLHPQKEARYQSAKALAEDLTRFLNGHPISLRTPTIVQRTRKLCQRHPGGLVAAICGIALIATAVITISTLWSIRMRPAVVEVSADRSHVELQTVAGRTLQSWTAPLGRGFTDAVLLSRRDSVSGTPLAILGYRDQQDHGDLLRVYSVNHFSHSPLWASRVEDDELPQELVDRGFTGQSFHLAMLRHLDIFPEHDGCEIVAVYRNENLSHCLLRIYSNTGQSLYQFWHDGVIYDIRFFPRSATLVCAAVNSEVFSIHRGMPRAGHQHPFVVFATKPQTNTLHNGWLTTTEVPNRVEPNWYYAINFADSIQTLFDPVFGTTIGSHDPSEAVNFTLRVRSSVVTQSATWTIKVTGEVLSDGPLFNDGWKLDPELPKDGLWLGELPAILPQFQDRAGPGRVTPPARFSN